jgi:Tol biopolymer transport system component
LARGASRPFDPAWSPDGAWIVYCEDGAERSTRLCVIHPDGSGRHFLTAVDKNRTYGDPQWSTDSKRIVVWTNSWGWDALWTLATFDVATALRSDDGIVPQASGWRRLTGWSGPKGSDCFDSPSGLAVGNLTR